MDPSIDISGRDQVRPTSAAALHAPSSRSVNRTKKRLLHFCDAARRKEARFTLLKGEGNDLVKRGCFQEALQKYGQCLTLKPEECTLYTNR